MGGHSLRISDLSHRVGVPVPTIKFYLREGLLPRGRTTGRNQAQYGDVHLRRLRLIRTLTTVGGANLATVRDLVKAIESDDDSLADLVRTLGKVSLPDASTVAPAADDADGPPAPSATLAEADEMLSRLNWRFAREGRGYSSLTRALSALDTVDQATALALLTRCAALAELLAEAEFAPMPDGDGASEEDRAAFVTRSILMDIVFIALRRMAHEHQLTRL
jgi:DNA-binding transcriptional MerR regulator